MVKRARAYWKQFVGLGTAYAHKYRVDPFFRTQVHVIGLQVIFSLCAIALMGLALALLYQSTLTSIIARIQEAIVTLQSTPGASHIVPVPTFADVQSGTLTLIVIASIVVTIAFAYLMIEVALEPTKHALASQKQFIGNIAHELRTPLSTIKMNTEVALLDSVPDAIKKTLDTTLEELDRISDIINNLLSLNTLVRPEAAIFTNVDLGLVVEDAVHKVQDLASQKHLTISTRISDFKTVWGNKAALEQIALNVIKNAAQYTPPGGHIAITVHPTYHGSIEFIVEDNGIGISEKDLFHIFEPFYRGDVSRTRKDGRASQGGSGLGLAIVSELVKLQHGKISVRSAIKRGTTVTLTLRAGHTTTAPTSSKVHGEITVDFSKEMEG